MDIDKTGLKIISKLYLSFIFYNTDIPDIFISVGKIKKTIIKKYIRKYFKELQQIYVDNKDIIKGAKNKDGIREGGIIDKIIDKLDKFDNNINLYIILHQIPEIKNRITNLEKFTNEKMIRIHELYQKLFTRNDISQNLQLLSQETINSARELLNTDPIGAANIILDFYKSDPNIGPFLDEACNNDTKLGTASIVLGISGINSVRKAKCKQYKNDKTTENIKVELKDIYKICNDKLHKKMYTKHMPKDIISMYTDGCNKVKEMNKKDKKAEKAKEEAEKEMKAEVAAAAAKAKETGKKEGKVEGEGEREGDGEGEGEGDVDVNVASNAKETAVATPEVAATAAKDSAAEVEEVAVAEVEEVEEVEEVAVAAVAASEVAADIEATKKAAAIASVEATKKAQETREKAIESKRIAKEAEKALVDAKAQTQESKESKEAEPSLTTSITEEIKAAEEKAKETKKQSKKADDEAKKADKESKQLKKELEKLFNTEAKIQKDETRRAAKIKRRQDRKEGKDENKSSQTSLSELSGESSTDDDDANIVKTKEQTKEEKKERKKSLTKLSGESSTDDDANIVKTKEQKKEEKKERKLKKEKIELQKEKEITEKIESLSSSTNDDTDENSTKTKTDIPLGLPANKEDNDAKKAKEEERKKELTELTELIIDITEKQMEFINLLISYKKKGDGNNLKPKELQESYNKFKESYDEFFKFFEFDDKETKVIIDILDLFQKILSEQQNHEYLITQIVKECSIYFIDTATKVLQKSVAGQTGYAAKKTLTTMIGHPLFVTRLIKFGVTLGEVVKKHPNKIK